MDGTLHERMSADAERKLAQKGRAGPGKNATAPDTTVLNNAQDAAFNEILRHSFDEGTFKIVKASELGITDLGDFQFCVHYGLEARIDKYNKENPSVNLPSDRVCAGRGGARFKHKLSQAHISDYRFNALLMKGDAGTKVLHIIAYHEDAHIKIANGKLVNYLGIDEEDFVDFHVSDASTRTALPQLGGKNVRQVLVDIDKDRMADEAYRMEETLLIDTDYGTTARDEIIRLHGEDKHDEARNFAKEVYMRLHNIDLANTSLTQANYKGYDIMIVSCTTPEEAAYQQKVLEEAFGGVNTSNGYMKNKVCVLAVVDMSEGGQIIGQVVTMLQARKPFKKWAQANGLTDTDIDSYLKNNKARMAIYHNGGKGERFSPGSQGYGNSRGAQPYSNPVAASEGRMIEDANLILGVVRSTNALAMSMPENDYRVDTYWANQTAFGTVDATKVQRSNYLFDKFVVKVPKNPKMKDLFDYGTAVISSTGRIIKFLANRVLTKKDPKSGNYVDNPDYKKERDELLSSPRGSYDYGSFSMSKALHFAMMNYWIDVKHIDKVMGPNMDHKAGISRDIDPAFVQIIVPIMSGLRMKHMLVLPLASHLDAAADKTALLETAYDNILAAMDDEFALAIRKIHDKKKKDPVTGKDTAEIDRASRMTVLETVEMMIRYPDIFADTDRVVGSIDLGANSYWFAFKRILDMANNRLLMLADIIDRNIELEPTGEATSSPSSTDDKLRAEAARRVFGIKNDAVAVFEVNGKIIRLTAKQMKDGWSGDGVEVKRSIIQGKCILLPGSKIVKSFVNNSSGRIVSENSYIETSVAPVITAKNSIIIKVIDTKSVSADKEIVADAYRPAIKDVRFPDGQTRMRAPVGYDPKPVDRELAAKMSDAVKFGDNAYSFQEIREMLCDKADNDRIESGLREKAYTEIHSKVRVSVQVNMTPEWAAAREKYAYSQMSFPMPLLGTSGERGISQKQLTDIRVITMQAGNLSMLADRYNIRPGDAVVFAGDLRPSTPRVAKDAILSTLQQKFNVNWQGYVSTPTVVYWATTNGKPMVSIMITASHNPVRGEKETVADMPSKFENNGLKLNSPTGEILKEDEPWLVEHIKEAELLQFTIPWGEDICGKDGKIKTEGLSAEQRELLGIIDQVMANPGKEAENAYILRNTTEGIGRVFDGEHIGFNEHTGVARDVLPQILRAVGLDVHNYGRSYWEERMDTEDLEPKIEQHMKAEAARLKAEGIDAISHDSTDGDADRPALFDSNGNFIYGDKICGLLCIGLKEDNPQKDFVVVVTATCSEAMVKMLREKYKMKVIKVEVGSPYVVSEMAKQEKLNPGAIVVGFERNTGFFVQTPIVLKNGNTIKKLATRDSAIVIEQVNLLAKKRGMNLEQLVDSEYNGVYESYSWSDGVTNSTPGCEAYTAPVGKAIMRSLAPKDRNMLVIEFDDAGQVYYTNRAAYYGTGTSRILANADVKDRMRRIRNYLSGVFTPAEDFGTIVKMEFIDGVRIFFDNNEIVHLRPSGNEPKWRIYPESPAEKGARARKISDMRLEAYPQMIRDYIAKIGTGAKPVMVPRSVAGIKASLKKLLPSLVIPEDGELKTLNMRFGPETQHLLERGISFAKDDRSFTMYSTRTYNKFAGGQPQSTLQISIIAYPEERRVVYSEIKDGVEVMRAECVGEKAWVELGVGLDKNVPVGKFQDAIFPVMPQETIDKLKNSGVVLLRLLDMTSENEIEPSLWGPED
ncbi:MAG: hypothetical protein NTZ95_02260, partial [Candidatus Omnitrophica bacterium]|nr:hypothetical protein [Candidatus Omnitrophota bacterium]